MARILVLTLLIVTMSILASIPSIHGAGQEILSKGTSLTYVIIHRSPTGVEKEYYIVTVIDAFQGTQGMVYSLKISYLGRTSVTAEKNVPEYDVSSYIPICSEFSTEEIKTKGQYSYILPIPVFDLIPRMDPKEPVAYTSVKLSLVTITNYVLNLTKTSYKLKALYMKGSYKGYTVQAYLEEKTGLLLRMAFINPKTKSLEYEIKLAYATNIGLLTKQENISETPEITQIIPLLFVLTIVAAAMITLIIAVRKISRIMGP